MTNDIHELALELADKELSKHFDSTAYIVKCLAESRIDKVPESDIDEHIDTMQDFFILYMKDRNINSLKNMMSQSVQMLCELRHLINTNEEIQEFEDFKNKVATL